MPDISIVDIIDNMSQHMDEDDANELLAMALEAMGLEVQESYTAPQVVAIGTWIADAQRETLRESDIEEAQQLERVIAPFIDGLKADAFETQPDAVFEDDGEEDEAEGEASPTEA
jgi:hypothetical protein